MLAGPIEHVSSLTLKIRSSVSWLRRVEMDHEENHSKIVEQILRPCTTTEKKGHHT